MEHVIDVDAARSLAVCPGIISTSKNLLQSNSPINIFVKSNNTRAWELKWVTRPVNSYAKA